MTTAAAVQFSDEYKFDVSADAYLKFVEQYGRLITEQDSVWTRLSTKTRESYPLTNWLLALAVCLFLADVAMRRFQYVPGFVQGGLRGRRTKRERIVENIGENKMFSKKTKWEADAGNLSDFGNFDTFVYRNGSVDSFLNDSGKSFVIAAKGVGKTLLLSYKRYLLENKYGTSLTFIPNQHPYISFVESIKTTLSNEHLSKLQDWEYCKRLWVLIIELCLISYSKINTDNILDIAPERVRRYNFILKELILEANPIEYIFNEIITENVQILKKKVNTYIN